VKQRTQSEPNDNLLDTYSKIITLSTELHCRL